MREIELKFRVNNKEELIKKLESLNCNFTNEITQCDTIYVSNLNDVESKEGSVWLRVRKEDDKIELNFKKQSSKLQESQEIEFGVDSYEKANDFLSALGFKKWVAVNKKRRFTKYLNYNLCLDEVERLGTFIEIEIVVDEQDQKDYIEDLLTVANSLGLSKQDIINSHYDTMISELD